MKKRTLWTYEGDIYIGDTLIQTDWCAHTVACTHDEARRNIIWQYKKAANMPRSIRLDLTGNLYRDETKKYYVEDHPINFETGKPLVQAEQLKMNI